MVYTFTLPFQAFSVNAYRFRRNFIKTPEAVAYEAKVLEALEEHKMLHDIADQFRDQGGVFKVKVNCIYPKHIFLNESGNISARTLDVDNVLKPIIDLVMTKFMGISDRFVIECASQKSMGLSYSTKISISLLPNPF